jgi:hypothetical protein
MRTVGAMLRCRAWFLGALISSLVLQIAVFHRWTIWLIALFLAGYLLFDTLADRRLKVAKTRYLTYGQLVAAARKEQIVIRRD